MRLGRQQDFRAVGREVIASAGLPRIARSEYVCRRRAISWTKQQLKAPFTNDLLTVRREVRRRVFLVPPIDTRVQVQNVRPRIADAGVVRLPVRVSDVRTIA